MAERRMFAKTIIDSDAFLDMPLSTQALYFHLSMRADDDGFINNPKKIQRLVGASEDDLKLLIAKNFIIPFESGIVVIKHWKIHNYIQKDRYKETVYKEEKALLSVKENSSYTLSATECIQDGYGLETQDRIGKDSIDKVSIDKVSKESNRGRKFVPPTLEEVNAYISEKGLSVDGKAFLEYFTATNWIDSKGNKVKSWKGKLLVWNNFESKNAPAKKQPYMESSSLKDDLAMLEELAIKGGKA